MHRFLLLKVRVLYIGKRNSKSSYFFNKIGNKNNNVHRGFKDSTRLYACVANKYILF